MRGKYDQVNEFLRIVGDTVLEEPQKTFTVVDCGCGKAYLTISLWFYLTQVKGFKNVRIVGIDRRNDVISAARKMTDLLDVSGDVSFVECDL